ncbi:MAG: ABC transporter ATP-binding protein [Bacteroidetes bacterium]|nr:ABC transporter ATP-binding protein [Bacteroidota bacterium]
MESGGNSVNRVSIIADGISKKFDHRIVFRNISFSLSTASSLSVTGKNGAGKSTLLKTIAGLISPTEGSIRYTINNDNVDIEMFRHAVGFVSPYLNFYDEFSASENINILARIRSAIRPKENAVMKVLETVGLPGHCNDLVGTYSSGMKQRLKYAYALLNNPAVLILDEPTGSLDDEGIEIARQIAEQQKKNGILIIAANDAREARWCDQEVRL